jgi:hypothetical protein
VLFGAWVVPSDEGTTPDTSPCKAVLFGAAVVASEADIVSLEDRSSPQQIWIRTDLKREYCNQSGAVAEEALGS